MTKKVYRTAQGKIVDLGALQLSNEHTRAVGNMGVNARGDLIDSKNRPISSKNEQVAKQYRRQTNNVKDEPVFHNPKATTRPSKSSAPVPTKADIPPTPEDFDDNVTKESAAAEGAGLAAAIAKAKQIQQPVLKTPREVAQHQQGVTKI